LFVQTTPYTGASEHTSSRLIRLFTCQRALLQTLMATFVTVVVVPVFVIRCPQRGGESYRRFNPCQPAGRRILFDFAKPVVSVDKPATSRRSGVVRDHAKGRARVATTQAPTTTKPPSMGSLAETQPNVLKKSCLSNLAATHS